MIRLLKKFSLPFIIFILLSVGLVFPLFNYDRVTGPDPLTLNFVYTLAPYLFFVVLGAVYIHEQWEQRNNAYAFLRLLPVKPSDIVVSKFLLILLSVIIYTGFHCVAFFKISNDPSYWKPSCSFLIINGNICLILTALLYVGIFRYGYNRIGKFVILLWLFIVFSPIPINIFLLRRLGISRREIIENVNGLNWALVTIVCLTLYYLLMRVAIKTLEREEPTGG